jgi:hypothetical protein
MITSWIQEDANCADVRELPAPIDPDFNQLRLAELSAGVFGRWCDLL